MSDNLSQTIAEYRLAHGDAENRYYKKHIARTKFGREPGYHCVPVGDGEEVSKDEYEAHAAESRQNQTDAFMGRLQRSYWRYDQKLSREGWREILVREIQAFAG